MEEYLDNFLKEEESNSNQKSIAFRIFITNVWFIWFLLAITITRLIILKKAKLPLDEELTKKMRKITKDDNIEVLVMNIGIPNAFNAGFSKLYYTKGIRLLLPEEQLIAVLLHEYGHYKEKHMYKQMMFGALVEFLIANAIIELIRYYTQKGKKVPKYVKPYSLLVGRIAVTIIRKVTMGKKHEYIADSYANKYGYGKEFIKSMKTLDMYVKSRICKNAKSEECENKLSKLSRLDEHPTFKRRIEKITNLVEKKIESDDIKGLAKIANSLQKIIKTAKFIGKIF